MRLLKHIRSRSKIKNDSPSLGHYHSATSASWPAQAGQRDYTARLPPFLLAAIFDCVCPHTHDESFESSEDSAVDDGCMLCDMRDLAHCAAVCRRWAAPAQDALYHSVRIDAVHYCEREIELSEKRKRRSFFERNGDPKDAPQQRLQLFARTVRENPHLAVRVQLLKMPYMTRETCKPDLARTASVLPNLQYIDLPDGFFTDEPSCHTLKNEVQARCPDLQKMRYLGGSEQSFTLLANTRHWQSLQILEISHLDVEPNVFLHVLSSLPTLHDLKLSDLPWLDDNIFTPHPYTLPFPPIQKLSLSDILNVTAAGLSAYLNRPETREVLDSLTLSSTGIIPSEVHHILARAPHLTHLSLTEIVTRSFPLDPVPPLRSTSLHTLHYEITSASTSTTATKPASSYYTYLLNSLQGNHLPALRSLYVRDSTFPESLTLLPPAPRFASGSPARNEQAYLHNPLSVYSKGLDELEWVFTHVSPPRAPGQRGSYTPQRPVSAYNLGLVGAHDSLSPNRASGLSPAWGGDARKSMVVGNGFGGFLAVPVDDGGGGGAGRGGAGGSGGGGGGGSFGASAGSPLAKGKGHVKKGSRHDLWR
ncbi:MAG: hypothetical protein M1817_000592 [Caeruleum heppii]|nr:MAG: hypothetical protein M1817_000592 [Caeruleum heppii]